jgi:hypothetical protein
VLESTNDAFAIECKFQDSEGTVDEKIPYPLDDLERLPMQGCIAYAGKGFSQGVQHMLNASPLAAYCLPIGGQSESSLDTRELDHLLAMHFPLVGRARRQEESRAAADSSADGPSQAKHPRTADDLDDQPLLIVAPPSERA